MAFPTEYFPLISEYSPRYLLVRGSVKLRQWFDSLRPSGGIHVMDEEWDNLFILDGCRYDLFERNHQFPGTLRRRRSAGSHSSEFIQHNFVGQEHFDTVYVTANPWSILAPDTFHATINLFDKAWDEELLTVPPEPVVQATRRAREQYPDKRLLVHFMQPHYPFLGSEGKGLETGGVTGHIQPNIETKTNRTYDSIWDKLDVGVCTADTETVWEAYVDNFRLVADHATSLADQLDGKTVITSDHGNLFGERLWPAPVRKYGHPQGIRHRALVGVPWHELPVDERRRTRADPPVETEDIDEDVIDNRLEALGYK